MNGKFTHVGLVEPILQVLLIILLIDEVRPSRRKVSLPVLLVLQLQFEISVDREVQGMFVPFGMYCQLRILRFRRERTYSSSSEHDCHPGSIFLSG